MKEYHVYFLKPNTSEYLHAVVFADIAEVTNKDHLILGSRDQEIGIIAEFRNWHYYIAYITPDEPEEPANGHLADLPIGEHGL